MAFLRYSLISSTSTGSIVSSKPRSIHHECQNHIQTDKMARVYIKDRRIAQQRLAFNALGERLDALFNDQTLAEIKPFKRKG